VCRANFTLKFSLRRTFGAPSDRAIGGMGSFTPREGVFNPRGGCCASVEGGSERLARPNELTRQVSQIRLHREIGRKTRTTQQPAKGTGVQGFIDRFLNYLLRGRLCRRLPLSLRYAGIERPSSFHRFALPALLLPSPWRIFERIGAK